jgi:ribosomal protein S6-L-glutamate ligase RimK-like protein
MPKYTIAIHPDDYTAPDRPAGSDASSPRWAKGLVDAGHDVRWVDVRRADILDQLHDCQGFMWRWAHFAGMARIARRLLPVIERELKLPVYPDQNTCWHYDDKIAQAYVLNALGVPMPKTWIWFEQMQARNWADHANYPLVLKLATGASSKNVKLIRNSQQARLWIDRLFSSYIAALDDGQYTFYRRVRRSAAVLFGRSGFSSNGGDLESGYVLFQEFLPKNDYDTRVTVIGNRAFAFRRFNRPNDFRASGSGNFDTDPSKIDERFVRLAFSTAAALQAKSCAIDGLYRDQLPVVGEVSYTYVSWAVNACPGHWELEGDPTSGALRWVSGQMWPEEAQISDFIVRLRDYYQ